ncbi:hypothetical protein AW879_09980 [Enterobacter cloacae]|nr:hypothetical protein AW879_09980 [Enterobacter cloacae]
MAEIQHFAKRPYEKGAQFLCADFRFTIRIIYYPFTLKAFDARRYVGAKTRNLAGEVTVTLRVELKPIDPALGSATGHVVKYISKTFMVTLWTVRAIMKVDDL